MVPYDTRSVFGLVAYGCASTQTILYLRNGIAAYVESILVKEMSQALELESDSTSVYIGR